MGSKNAKPSKSNIIKSTSTPKILITKPLHLVSTNHINEPDKQQQKEENVPNNKYVIMHKKQRTLLVSGYIREIESLLKHQIIPTSINLICYEYYNSRIDSLTLCDEELTILFKLLSERNLGNQEMNLQLLFRGSRDGFTANAFHSRCNRKNTICIIKSDTNNVFGGFTSVPWKNYGAYQKDENAFLFLLRSSENYQPQIFEIGNHHVRYAVDHMPKNLCIFGCGYDLAIYTNCNANKNSYTKKSSYDIPTSAYLNGDQRNFMVKEIEVYTLVNETMTTRKTCLIH